jgi:hypothetical protein
MDTITDVTAAVGIAVPAKADGLQRQQAIENATKALVASCESEPGYRCSVYSFFGGVQYRLFKQMEIKDVRLVYAPPGSIGNYGGEVDNWMWPRHTGDFTLIRAYVGKDGKPAAYSKDNVPHQPLRPGRRIRQHRELDLSVRQRPLQSRARSGARRRQGRQGHRD